MKPNVKPSKAKVGTLKFNKYMNMDPQRTPVKQHTKKQGQG